MNSNEVLRSLYRSVSVLGPMPIGRKVGLAAICVVLIGDVRACTAS